MSRVRVLCLILGVLLAVLVVARNSEPTAAATWDAEPAAPAAVALRVPSASGPDPHFGYNSVLGQVATSINNVATSIDSTPAPNPKTIVVTPGPEITFSVSGAIQNANDADVVVLYDASLTYLTDTGDCFPATIADMGGLPPQRPANLGGVLQCFPVPFGVNQPFSFLTVFEVNNLAPPHAEQNFNVACVENSPTPGVYNLCSTVAGVILGPTPTPTLTPTATPTTVLVLPPPPPPMVVPPPAPPLAPPPLLPPSLAAPFGAPAASARPMAPVPIIPEADSLLLAAGGLAAVGLIAGWRAWRRRAPIEAKDSDHDERL